MAFTYDVASDLGKVRLLIADTVEDAGPRPDKRNYSDEEIAALMGSAGVYAGAAKVADALAAEFASRVNTTAGPLKTEWAQGFEHWQTRAQALRERASAEGETVATAAALQSGTITTGQTELLSDY